MQGEEHGWLLLMPHVTRPLSPHAPCCLLHTRKQRDVLCADSALVLSNSYHTLSFSNGPTEQQMRGYGCVSKDMIGVNVHRDQLPLSQLSLMSPSESIKGLRGSALNI